MWNSFHWKDYLRSTVMELSLEEIKEYARNTVQGVMGEMPDGLTIEDQKKYLANAGRILSTASVLINEMLMNKPRLQLH